MQLHRPLILDFDSTLIKVEGLDELASLCLAGKPQAQTTLAHLKNLTVQGMEGTLSFPDSLQKRLSLLTCHRQQIDQLGQTLLQKITPSFVNNIDFLRAQTHKIFVVSGGFKEYIYPVTDALGILRAHVYANTFTYDAQGVVLGYDPSILLSKEKGKVLQLMAMPFQDNVYVIGDGMTDYEMTQSGRVEAFFAFTENIARPSVVKKSHHPLKSFDEFLVYLHREERKHIL